MAEIDRLDIVVEANTKDAEEPLARLSQKIGELNRAIKDMGKGIEMTSLFSAMASKLQGLGMSADKAKGDVNSMARSMDKEARRIFKAFNMDEATASVSELLSVLTKVKEAYAESMSTGDGKEYARAFEEATGYIMRHGRSLKDLSQEQKDVLEYVRAVNAEYRKTGKYVSLAETDDKASWKELGNSLGPGFKFKEGGEKLYESMEQQLPFTNIMADDESAFYTLMSWYDQAREKYLSLTDLHKSGAPVIGGIEEAIEGFARLDSSMDASRWGRQMEEAGGQFAQMVMPVKEVAKAASEIAPAMAEAKKSTDEAAKAAPSVQDVALAMNAWAAGSRELDKGAQSLADSFGIKDQSAITGLKDGFEKAFGDLDAPEKFKSDLDGIIAMLKDAVGGAEQFNAAFGADKGESKAFKGIFDGLQKARDAQRAIAAEAKNSPVLQEAPKAQEREPISIQGVKDIAQDYKDTLDQVLDFEKRFAERKPIDDSGIQGLARWAEGVASKLAAAYGEQESWVDKYDDLYARLSKIIESPDRVKPQYKDYGAEPNMTSGTEPYRSVEIGLKFKDGEQAKLYSDARTLADGIKRQIEAGIRIDPRTYEDDIVKLANMLEKLEESTGKRFNTDSFIGADRFYNNMSKYLLSLEPQSKVKNLSDDYYGLQKALNSLESQYEKLQGKKKSYEENEGVAEQSREYRRLWADIHQTKLNIDYARDALKRMEAQADASAKSIAGIWTGNKKDSPWKAPDMKSLGLDKMGHEFAEMSKVMGADVISLPTKGYGQMLQSYNKLYDEVIKKTQALQARLEKSPNYANNFWFKKYDSDIDTAIGKMQALKEQMAGMGMKDKIFMLDVTPLKEADSKLVKIGQGLSKLKVIVPKEEFKGLQDEIEKTKAAYDKLVEKIRHMLLVKGQSKSSPELKQMQADLEGLRNEYDRLIQKQKDMALGGYSFNSEGASQSIGNAQQALSGLQGRLNAAHRALGGFVQKLMGMVPVAKLASNAVKGFDLSNQGLAKALTKTSRMLKTMLTRMALKQVISQMGEGFQVLARYSEDFNQTVSKLLGALSTLRYSIAAAAAPLVNALGPALQYIARLCIMAVNAINQLFAALRGQSTWIHAKDQAVDYAESLNKAGGAAKKLKTITLGIDELNINNQDDDAGGGGGTPEIIPEDIYEDLDIDSRIKEMADNVKDILKRLFDPMKEAWDKYGKSVMESWKKALSEVATLSKSIGRDFLEMWGQSETVAIFSDLLIILSDIGEVVAAVAHNFRIAWEGNDTGLKILMNMRDIVGAVVRNVREAVDATVTWAKSLDFAPLLAGIEGFLKSAIPLFDAVSGTITDFYQNVLLPLGKWTLEKGLPELLDVFKEFNEAIDWAGLRANLNEFWKHLEPFAEKVGEGLITFIRDVSDVVAGFVNSDGFKNFLKSVEEWMDKVDAEDVANGMKAVVGALIALKGALIALTAINGINTVFTSITTFLGWFGNATNVAAGLQAITQSLGGLSGALGTLAVSGGATILFNEELKKISGNSTQLQGDIVGLAFSVNDAATSFANGSGTLGSLVAELSRYKEAWNQLVASEGFDKAATMAQPFNELVGSLNLSNDELVKVMGSLMGVEVSTQAATGGVSGLSEAMDKARQGIIFTDEEMSNIQSTLKLTADDAYMLMDCMWQANEPFYPLMDNFRMLDGASAETLSNIVQGMAEMKDGIVSSDSAFDTFSTSAYGMTDTALAFFKAVQDGDIVIDGFIQALETDGANAVIGFNKALAEEAKKTGTIIDNWAGEMVQTMHDSALKFGSPSKTMYDFGIDAVQGFNDAIGEYGTTTLTAFAEWVQLIADNFPAETWSEMFAGLPEGLMMKWQEFSDLWNGELLPSWFDSSVIPWFTSEKWMATTDGMKAGLMGKWKEFTTLWQADFTMWWNTWIIPYFAKEKWEPFGENMKEGLYSGFKGIVLQTGGVMNGLIEVFNKGLSNIESAINDLIDQFNSLAGAMKVPTLDHVSARNIAKVDIPAFANGGFPTAGSLFWAGEAGAELVGTVNGKTAVASNDEITQIAKAVYETGANTVNGLNIMASLLEVIASKDTSIELDGRELVSAMEERKARTGFSFT